MAELLPYKVLIVDDHSMARQIVFGVIQSMGVTQIETAEDGAEAREKLYAAYDAGRPFDIVFLDWNMPEVEGIDVLKHFRTHPEFALTAFIMLTAQGEQGEVLHAAKSGATSYIVKPASKETISKKFLETIEWVKKQKAKSSNLHLPPRKK
jgi:two-component system, chemotaxis family, chemotaxis protein CheY